MRVGFKSIAVLTLFLSWAPGAPQGNAPVPLRDLRPRFVKAQSPLYRSRSRNKAGLWIGGQRYRGLMFHAPGRVGFELDKAFRRLTIDVAVPDGNGADPHAGGAVRFEVRGDGRVLVATPPLFAGQAPVALDLDVSDVVLLELVAHGKGRAAWLGGRLRGLHGADPARFRSVSAPFSPQAYPASFRRKVNRAIDAGVRYLLHVQEPDGSWKNHVSHRDGTTALVALALFKAGVRRTEPAMVRALAYLRGRPLRSTYAVAVLLMAIEAAYFPRGATPRRAVKVISEADQVWLRRASDWLAQQQGAGFPKGQGALNPVWRYPRGGYDLSCTQYALFGLAAARRCGVPHSDVWLPTLRFLLGAQEVEGPKVTVSRYFRAGKFMRRRTERALARGFGYQLNTPPTGSMTSAGLCALIQCQAALGSRTRFRPFRERTRRAVRDALAWLEEYYDLTKNPFRGRDWWTYYLFNIERVGVLLDQRYLGTRDWYREGAELLMGIQRKGGRFGAAEVDTAFALLFLKRATVSPLTQTRR